MLWLALRFPSLPLEIVARGDSSPGPLAVASSNNTNAEILICNRKARECGVRAGMPLAAALALASSLNVFARNPASEREAIERMAACASRYTSTVSIASSDEILLEIGGSVRLFGGFNRLWTRIEEDVDAWGYAVRLACAPTPLAAQLFARAGLPVRIRHHDALHASLSQLPLDVLGLSGESIALLQDIGVSNIGACLRLPRAGLARRVGTELPDSLDRALGHAPDPRPTYVAPETFAAALQLPAPVADAAALMFASRRLLAELCGFLAATAKGAQILHFGLAHEGRGDTCFELNLTAATRDLEHLVSVLRERLAGMILPSPATAIRLKGKLLLPLASRNLAFLPDAREEVETAARLIERLRARLGEKAVHGLDAVADYRPERAWRVTQPGAASEHASLPASRPLWILDSSRLLAEIGGVPQHDGPLSFVSGPERIKPCWWDGDTEREYFIMRNPAHSLLWIYRETSGNGGWYLQGFFG